MEANCRAYQIISGDRCSQSKDPDQLRKKQMISHSLEISRSPY